MASSSAQEIGSSDAYAQAINNGQATLSLANNILQFDQALANAFLRVELTARSAPQPNGDYSGIWGHGTTN